MYAGYHADYVVLPGTLSTEDADAAGPDGPAADVSAAPASQGEAAGGEARPRGRRFSAGRPPASGAPPQLVRPSPATPGRPAGNGLDTLSADPGAAAGSGAGRVPGGVDGVLPGGDGVAVAAGSAPVVDSVSEPVLMTPVFLAGASRLALGWAGRRHLGLSSACGISIALAACAATWFSAGTRVDLIRGVAALWAGYLVLEAGRRLYRQAAEADTGAAVDRRRAGPAAWLAALGSGLAETIVYAGLALGAAAERWPDTWLLAAAVLGLVAVRNLMTASSTPYGFSWPPDGAFGRTCAAVVTMATGGRILVVGVVAPIWGARTALLVLVAWAISSVGYGLAGRAAEAVTAEPGEPAGSDPAGAPATLLRLRDDGILARSLGRLVKGKLLPLPPAVLGLTAILALAAVGLHGLPGALMISPAIVMLLAAPGSAHSHAGRFDWLVPVLLLGSQVLYFCAVGAGGHVPGPAIFALVAALALRYADLACPGRPVLLAKPRRDGVTAAELGTALGWEGRLLLIGVTAAMGIATAGYLALTAYLSGLIGAKIVQSCLAPEPEDEP